MAELDVLLFTVDRELAGRAAAAGVSGFVVDWEDRRALAERATCDQGTRRATTDDLRRIAAVGSQRVVCRINPVGAHTTREVEEAIDHGATDVLVPMVETPRELSRVVDLVRGRALIGVMIETVEACRNAAEIAQVPPDFIYVGLLDLAISRREGNVFRPLADGTADRIREAFAETRFGIGGVTVLDKGSPVPCPVLLGELARLRTDFAFARRSYLRDTTGRDLAVEGARLRAAWDRLIAREPLCVARDHELFVSRFGASRARTAPQPRLDT